MHFSPSEIFFTFNTGIKGRRLLSDSRGFGFGLGIGEVSMERHNVVTKIVNFEKPIFPRVLHSGNVKRWLFDIIGSKERNNA